MQRRAELQRAYRRLIVGLACFELTHVLALAGTSSGAALAGHGPRASLARTLGAVPVAAGDLGEYRLHAHDRLLADGAAPPERGPEARTVGSSGTRQDPARSVAPVGGGCAALALLRSVAH